MVIPVFINTSRTRDNLRFQAFNHPDVLIIELLKSACGEVEVS
jgi:hypothetical protein